MSAHSSLGDLAGRSMAPLVDAFLLQKATRGNDGKAQSVSAEAPKAKD